MEGKWRSRVVVTLGNEDEARDAARGLRAKLREAAGGSKPNVPVAKRFIDVAITLRLGGSYANDSLSAGIWALTRVYDLWPGDKPIRQVMVKTVWERSDG